MIVVEGCDGTGKTTLARALSDDLGLSIGPRGTANRDELHKVTKEDSYHALAHMVEGYHPAYIWDRLGFFSDPIYARVMGRECAFTRPELRFGLNVMQIVHCPVVFCMVPLDVGQENILKDHQMDQVEENYAYLHGLYEGAQMAVADWTWTYDYREDGAYTDVLEKCRHYIVKRKEREWH